MAFYEYDLENSDIDVNIEVPEDATVGIVADEAAALDAELQELEVTIAVTEDQIAQGEELVEEAAADAADNSITLESAKHYAARLATLKNITSPKRVRAQNLFDLESFSVAGGKQTFNIEFLESAKSTIRGWWQRLKDLIQKYVDKAYDFYMQHASGVGRLEKAFIAMRDRADKLTGDRKETTLKIGAKNIERLVYKRGANFTFADVNNELSTGNIGFNPSTAAKVKKHLDDIKAAFAKINPADRSTAMTLVTSDQIKSVEDIVQMYSGSVTGDATSDNGCVGGPMFGNRTLKVTVTESGADSARRISSISMITVPVDPKLKIEADATVPALTSDEIAKLASTGAKSSRLLRDLLADARRHKDIVKGILSEGDKIIPKLEKSDTADAAEIRAAINVGIAGARITIQATRIATSSVMGALQAAYSWCSMSASNYKKS